MRSSIFGKQRIDYALLAKTVFGRVVLLCIFDQYPQLESKTELFADVFNCGLRRSE